MQIKPSRQVKEDLVGGEALELFGESYPASPAAVSTACGMRYSEHGKRQDDQGSLISMLPSDCLVRAIREEVLRNVGDTSSWFRGENPKRIPNYNQ